MNKVLAERLMEMDAADKALRDKILREGNLYEGYAPEMEALHLRHAEELAGIIAEHGWPSKTLVGEDGARAAWLIAQHSISSPPLQTQFLEELGKAAAKGDASPIQHACLQDRVLFNQGKPQLFGMLFDWDEDGALTANVDDVGATNRRRKKLGLSTLEDALELHLYEIDEEGGGPPSDIKKHKQLGEEWARRVGWRD